MIFLKSGSRTIEASDAQTHSIGEPDSDFFTARRGGHGGAVLLAPWPPTARRTTTWGGKPNNLNLINQRFESIQPDGLVSCDTSNPNGQIGVRRYPVARTDFSAILFQGLRVSADIRREPPRLVFREQLGGKSRAAIMSK